MKSKNIKKLFAATLAMGLLFTAPVTADAATTTKTTTISAQSEYLYNSGISNSGAIYVKLDEPGDYITNIKSKNPSLIAKQAYAYSYYYKTPDSTYNGSDYNAIIGLYAKKNLTTSVTFDVYGENNKKKETKTVKVIVKSTSYKSPVKSVTFSGKPIEYNKLYSAKSGKVKVKMNKNFKLLKLEVGTYTSPKKTIEGNTIRHDSEMVYKKFKNNSKITLGKYGYNYSYYTKYSDGKRYLSSSSDILATTSIRITYLDKKTKNTGTIYYTIHKLAK